jgi:TonB family protein
MSKKGDFLMKRLMFALVMALFAGTAAAQIKYVAVVETEVDAQSGAAAKLNKAEVRQITTVLRNEARNNMPSGKYKIMTAESVIAQGSAKLEECAEENCVITLGAKIGADFIVRGIVSMFGAKLTLSIEMYETEDGTLVGSARVSSEKAEDLLEKTVAESKVLYKNFVNDMGGAQKTMAQQTPPTTTQPIYQPSAQVYQPPATTSAVSGSSGAFTDSRDGGGTTKSVARADIFGNGGFAADVDTIISGVGGLKSGGDGGVGRKGVAGIGYGSGFGGGGGGLDDILAGSTGGDGLLKKKGELRVSSPDFLKNGALTGGRSRENIQRVVMQNMAALRYAYNKRLRQKPGLTGKIVVKFSIDEFGKVISANVVESTMADSELESTVVFRVKSWNFEKIDKPGDISEVTYPIVFAQ